MNHNKYRDPQGNLRIVYTEIIHNRRAILVLRPLLDPHPIKHIAKIIKRKQIQLEKYKRHSQDRITRPRLYQTMIRNHQNDIYILISLTSQILLLKLNIIISM